MSLLKDLLNVNIASVHENHDDENHDDEQLDFPDMVQQLFDDKRIHHLEGRKGLEALCMLCSAIGYKDSNYSGQLSRDASIGDLTNFLEDNSGAIEKLVEWISDHSNEGWKESLGDYLKGE